MSEVDAFTSQLVQMRRMGELRTVDADGVPPHLIRHDQQDIRFGIHLFFLLYNNKVIVYVLPLLSIVPRVRSRYIPIHQWNQ